MQQGSRNLNDGLGLIRTAEAALNDVSGTFIRLRELASQAANGTVGATEKQTINLEYQNLLAEMDRISNSTEFRDTTLLDGSLAKSASVHLVLQLGADSSSKNQIDLNNELDLTQVSRAAFNLTDSNVTSQGSAFLALNDLTSAIDTLISIRSRAGSTQIRLTSALNNLNTQIENLSGAVSTIRDANIAEELALLTKNQILVQAGAAMLAQANLIPQAVLTLFEGV